MSSFDDPAEPTLGPATPARAAAASTPAPTSIDGRVIEEFARDFLKERRSERRWRAVRRLAWLLVFAAIAWAL
ncbi:MAG: S49 family peptidase, partial [Methylibium sp.]|nr:S49 family peptidase [Methylibium sp.]